MRVWEHGPPERCVKGRLGPHHFQALHFPHCHSGPAREGQGPLCIPGVCVSLTARVGFLSCACPPFPSPTSLSSPSADDLSRGTMEAFLSSEKSRQFPPWCLAREAM